MPTVTAEIHGVSRPGSSVRRADGLVLRLDSHTGNVAEASLRKGTIFGLSWRRRSGEGSGLSIICHVCLALLELVEEEVRGSLDVSHKSRGDFNTVRPALTTAAPHGANAIMTSSGPFLDFLC
jgi:hypothetical protein